MSEVPMEYRVMKKKFSKSLKKSLKDSLSSVIVYGGAASDRVFSGVSDIDFLIVLNSVENLTSLSEAYNKLGSEILSLLENPLFASLLDYDIYTVDQLPKDGDLNGFSAIRALALKTGETLVGDNPFADIELSKSQLKISAQVMVHEYLDKLTSLLFIPQFESILEDDEEPETPMQEDMEAEKEFLAVDAILSSTQAYQMITRNEYVSMPDVVLFGETEPIEGVDNELITQAGLLKQGVDADVDDLFNRAIDFCGDIIKLLNSL